MSTYTPSETALYARKYRINSDMLNKCQDLVCRQQRPVSTVPRELKYKLYNVCISCKTNWEKPTKHCKHCGLRLRISARNKNSKKM